jgi:TetR/AcrR family transcriptional repressor of bet genes
MPRLGMEPLRRRALIDATLNAVGERGSLDVTMSEIAARAGVSSALAHHYFGAKDDLLLATMRHLLIALHREAVPALAAAQMPRERIDAVVTVSFSPSQFSAEAVGAWLAFYVAAQHAEPMRRLLRIYARRLHANLMAGLVLLMPRREAAEVAETTAALIDGLYIRRALKEGEPDPVSAVALVRAYLDLRLANQRLAHQGEPA